MNVTRTGPAAALSTAILKRYVISTMDVNQTVKNKKDYDFCIKGINVSILYFLGKGVEKNRFFLGDLSQTWVGGVADSQTRSKPLKTPPNHPEYRPFQPKFQLSFLPNLTKTLGWVGG